MVLFPRKSLYGVQNPSTRQARLENAGQAARISPGIARSYLEEGA